MSAAADNTNAYPNLSCTQNERAINGSFLLTTAGAVGTTTADDTGMTLTKNGTTGQYDLAFPAFPTDCQIEIVEIYSPAQTIGQGCSILRSPTAGTASLMFSSKSGTNAYGASGDIIKVRVTGNTRA